MSEVRENQAKNWEILSAFNPDAIFIHSGGITKGRKVYPLKSTPYSSADHIGLLGGGRARVIAAASLHKLFPNTPIVANSTVTLSNGTVEPHAQVYTSELERRGVPTRQIITQEQSNSTATELVELLRLTHEHRWHRVVTLTNDYHIQRVEVMYEHLSDLFTPEYDEKISAEVARLLDEAKKSGLVILFQDAETVLRQMSPHYTKLIDDVKRTDEYKNRIVAEEKGTNDILEGNYKLRK